MKKLSNVVLIDDNDALNYLHFRFMQKANVAEEIIILNSALAALDYLANEGQTKLPDLILLDVNMPAMDGWEFVERYNHHLMQQAHPLPPIIMLSASFNPADRHKIAHYTNVIGFRSKPLNNTAIDEIILELLDTQV